MAFVPIRTSTLRPGAVLLFDTYVHYRDVYLKFRSAEEKIPGEVIERFQKKKVKKLFILADQEPSYLKYLDQALEDLREASAPLASRAELAQGSLRNESDRIEKTLESEEAYRSSESRIHKVVEFMLAEPKALAGMLTAAGLAVDDSAHGANVSSLCLGVGAHTEMLKREELTDLAVAGLLHDIGLKELGFDAKTVLADLPPDKRADFRKHPELGASRVAGKKFITPRVLKVIEDHEEYGDGLGFPGKKNLAKQPPTAQIFNLCDAFDHHCIRKGLSAAEGIDSFIEERAEHFALNLLEVLEKQVKAK